MELGSNGIDFVDWREIARWIRFEENVEAGGCRWSKPFLSTISLHGLFELRSCLLNGSVLLDLDANNLALTIDAALEDMVETRQINRRSVATLKQLLMLPKRHQHEFDKEQRLKHLMRKDSNKSSQSNSIIKNVSTISLPENLMAMVSTRTIGISSNHLGETQKVSLF